MLLDDFRDCFRPNGRTPTSVTSLCLQNACFVNYFDFGGGCSPLGPLTVRAWNCALSIAVGNFVGGGDSVNGGMVNTAQGRTG